jgi:hypothetical protein
MKVSSLRVTQHFTNEVDQVLDLGIGLRLPPFNDDCRTDHIACSRYVKLQVFMGFWGHHYHKLGECWSSKESGVRCLRVGYLMLQVFITEIFLSPKGHRKSDLVDGGCYCTRDYVVKRSPTRA